MRAVRPRVCVLPLIAALTTCRVQAQSPDTDPPGYAELIEQGLAEYDANHFLEARAVFARAHELFPNARTFRVLGMAEFELRHYPDSLRYLNAALASTVRPLDATLREQTQALAQRARQFVAVVRLERLPMTAELRLDGVPIHLAPGASLVLQVGEHTLALQAPGYQGETRTMDIRGGENLELRIALSPDPIHLPARPDAIPTKGEALTNTRPLYANPWFWSGIGAVSAGIVVTLAILLRPDDRIVPDDPVTTSQTPPGARILTLRER